MASLPPTLPSNGEPGKVAVLGAARPDSSPRARPTPYVILTLSRVPLRFGAAQVVSPALTGCRGPGPHSARQFERGRRDAVSDRSKAIHCEARPREESAPGAGTAGLSGNDSGSISFRTARMPAGSYPVATILPTIALRKVE